MLIKGLPEKLPLLCFGTINMHFALSGSCCGFFNISFEGEGSCLSACLEVVSITEFKNKKRAKMDTNV